MKIKKLASICSAAKRASIFKVLDSGDGLRQYITDGHAIYPIYGLPRLGKESLLTIFDIATEDWGKWCVTEIDQPSGIWVDDFPENGDDEAVTCFYNPISVNGVEIQPVLTKIGVVFFQRKYLDPVKAAEGGIQFYVRYNSEGEPYIVIKAGIFVQAIILEVKLKKEEMEKIEAMLRGYATRMGWDKPNAIIPEDGEAEQLNLYGRQS